MNEQEQVIEKLKDNGISNIDDAIKFLYDKEGAEEVEEVKVKWKVHFERDKPFEFRDDEDLIEWCREQRDTYFSEEGE